LRTIFSFLRPERGGKGKREEKEAATTIISLSAKRGGKTVSFLFVFSGGEGGKEGEEGLLLSKKEKEEGMLSSSTASQGMGRKGEKKCGDSLHVSKEKREGGVFLRRGGGGGGKGL